MKGVKYPVKISLWEKGIIVDSNNSLVLVVGASLEKREEIAIDLVNLLNKQWTMNRSYEHYQDEIER